MKKKLLLIFVCVFFLTGCDVTYNLTIDDDVNFKEDVVLSFLKTNTSYNDVLIYKENRTPVTTLTDESEYYNSSIIDNVNYYDLIYDYTHDINSIKNSYFLGNCYNDFVIYEDDDNIVLNSGKNFNCYIGDDGLRADSVKINITSELEVLSDNADEVNGNTYTWNINENNYLDKEIIITLKRDKISTLGIEKVGDSPSTTFLVIGIVIIVVFGLVFLFVRWRIRKNNNF